MVRRPDPERVFTLPNAVSAGRVACLPVFVWGLLGVHERYAAAWLLGGLGATDWLDGYLARHLGQVSTVGKVLDPVADRLLLIVAATAIVVDGSAPAWILAVAICRESVVALATIGLAAAGARRIEVSWFGKAGTFALMVALPLFVVHRSGASWRGPAGALAWATALPGLALGLVALAGYLPEARRALAEGRAGRVGRARVGQPV